MFKSIRFMMGYVWKVRKRYVIYQLIYQILTAAIPLADLVIPKFIIDELTGAQAVPQMLHTEGRGVYRVSDHDGRKALQLRL